MSPRQPTLANVGRQWETASPDSSHPGGVADIGLDDARMELGSGPVVMSARLAGCVRMADPVVPTVAYTPAQSFMDTYKPKERAWAVEEVLLCPVHCAYLSLEETFCGVLAAVQNGGSSSRVCAQCAATCAAMLQHNC